MIPFTKPYLNAYDLIRLLTSMQWAFLVVGRQNRCGIYLLFNKCDRSYDLSHYSPSPMEGSGVAFLMEGPGVAPGSWQGGGGKSEFDFPPVLYVDLPLYGMTYTLAVQVIQRQ